MDTFSVDLENRIRPLSHKKRVLFAVLTCERLYPSYVYFNEQEKWGKKESLQNGIVTIYEWLIGSRPVPVEEIKNVAAQIELVTPDTEDFYTLSVSFALDACTSILATIDYLLDPDIKHIITVAAMARDTVHAHVRVVSEIQANDPERQLKTQRHPATIALTDSRNRLLTQLSELDGSGIAKEQIEQLRDKTPIVELALL